jgi:hypothetical protein
MDKLTRVLLTTAFAGAMGLTALTPIAYAQDAGAPTDTPPMAQPAGDGSDQFQFGKPGDQQGRPGDDQRGGPRGPRGGGIAGLICSTDGAAQLETALTDLASKLQLTADQQPLFDAYQTATLAAQTSFADACPQMPGPGAGQPSADKPATPPDALTMMQNRQARATAELDAINAVLPSFEALYNSLTDTQKAALMPMFGPHQGGMHSDRGGDDRGGRHDDRGGDRGDNRGERGPRH